MPLRVKCPNGCVIQMPANRAGRIVRCPKCKAAMRVAPLFGSAVDQFKMAADGTAVAEGSATTDHQSEFAISINDRPAAIQADLISDRAARARSDRVLMARLLAVFLMIVAMINIAPAVVNWIAWNAGRDASSELPRWVYLQIFVAAIQLLYAILIFQVGDWSSLKAVSIALLVIAAIFGFVSAGLVVGGAQGTVAIFLGLPFVMVGNAIIWCVAMLLLSLVTSYLSGREAINWQRIDAILDRIVARPAGSGKP